MLTTPRIDMKKKIPLPSHYPLYSLSFSFWLTPLLLPYIYFYFVQNVFFGHLKWVSISIIYINISYIAHSYRYCSFLFRVVQFSPVRWTDEGFILFLASHQLTKNTHSQTWLRRNRSYSTKCHVLWAQRRITSVGEPAGVPKAGQQK
jgi:hypothetical protein